MVATHLIIIGLSVDVKLVQRHTGIEIVCMLSRFFLQHSGHVLLRNRRHHLNVVVVALNPILVNRYVFGIKQLGGRRIFA